MFWVIIGCVVVLGALLIGSVENWAEASSEQQKNRWALRDKWIDARRKVMTMREACEDGSIINLYENRVTVAHDMMWDIDKPENYVGLEA